MTNDDSGFGPELRRRRLQVGLTQAALADRLGGYGITVTGQAVGLWERSETRPEHRRTAKVLDQILGGGGALIGSYDGDDGGDEPPEEPIDLEHRITALGLRRDLAEATDEELRMLAAFLRAVREGRA